MPKSPKNPERSFGVSVGSVLCVLAGLLWWRGRPVRAEIAAGLGVVLLFFGLVSPAVLRRPAALWFRFSRALGHVNTRILLSVVFVIVFVPLSFVWRLTGKDPLARRRRSGGWLPYPASHRDSAHYTRMY